MAFFNVKTAKVQPDRRVARRYIVDSPARFSTASGERGGRLTDLSEHGARFESTAPPIAGTTGFLKWDAQDHYCTVVWVTANNCGIRFERPIAIAIVEASCRHIEITMKPVAAVSRIPLGQRRTGRVTAGH